MNDVTSPADPTSMTVAGADIELFERGSGAPLLFLHGAQGVRPAERFLDRLAAGRRVIAPSHPGFGGSSLPDWLDSIDDIAHIYLELMDRLKVERFDLVGCSVGGWIAADLATKTPERVQRLVLVGPVGVKVGSGRQARHPGHLRNAAGQAQRARLPRPEEERARHHARCQSPRCSPWRATARRSRS